jgi:hypothetical protein
MRACNTSLEVYLCWPESHDAAEAVCCPELHAARSSSVDLQQRLSRSRCVREVLLTYYALQVHAITAAATASAMSLQH